MSQIVLHINDRDESYYWVADKTLDGYKIARWWVYEHMRKHRSEQEMEDEGIQTWADVTSGDAFEYLDRSPGLDYGFGLVQPNPELL